MEQISNLPLDDFLSYSGCRGQIEYVKGIRVKADAWDIAIASEISFYTYFVIQTQRRDEPNGCGYSFSIKLGGLKYE